ncbi:unnamed protein product [Cercospora beticola]|nr:unnamed protein product [Cercospora beticola]
MLPDKVPTALFQRRHACDDGLASLLGSCPYAALPRHALAFGLRRELEPPPSMLNPMRAREPSSQAIRTVRNTLHSRPPMSARYECLASTANAPIERSGKLALRDIINRTSLSVFWSLLKQTAFSAHRTRHECHTRSSSF